MSFSMAYATKKHNKKMSRGGVACAEGGEVDSFESQDKAFSQDLAKQKARHEFTKQSLEIGEDVEASHLSHGGMADHEQDADMIARIMHKRKEYSQGGMVANDVGIAEADKLPAEYDDLVLRDDLEDDSGPGNEIGEDVVSRIMKRKK